MVHALSLLTHFELAGCYALNSGRAIEACRYKFRTLAHLRSAGVPIPKTILFKDPEQVTWALERLGGPPVILKPISGGQGKGVVLAETREGARSMVEALLLLRQDLLMQEYIAESAGRDVKILVCGDDVIGAVRRESLPGRFRATFREEGRA